MARKTTLFGNKFSNWTAKYVWVQQAKHVERPFSSLQNLPNFLRKSLYPLSNDMLLFACLFVFEIGYNYGILSELRQQLALLDL